MLISKVLSEFKIRFLLRLIYKSDSPVILAGLGRCGTTLLMESIRKTRGSVDLFITDVNKSSFKSGIIYKTHDYPNLNSHPHNYKVIFMFGNPMDTAISTLRMINEWGSLHFKHLHSDKYNPQDDLLYTDGLNLEALYDAWNKPQDFPFISIKYESLYEENTLDNLNEYLGYKLKLIPYEPRTSKWVRHPKKDILLKTYGNLYKKIQKAPNCKIWEPIKNR